ncbi:MAG: L-threonylcarbamoyladenylate synthase [Kineosporiaceae bacterium]
MPDATVPTSPASPLPGSPTLPVWSGEAAVERAAALLLAGGLVGLPTETVYGLSAQADDAAAVARVFAAKGRPADHPVIVHVASPTALDPEHGWARDVPPYARELAERLWPGPLTVIVARGPRSGYHVTGGQETVGLRCPDHPLALAVIEAVGSARGVAAGLAAPSANRFGRVSPTTAADVVADLGPHLDPARDAVLDGGRCRVGVESTIVSCLGPTPRILRPGGIDAATVAAVTGLVVTDTDGTEVAPGGAAEAVGTAVGGAQDSGNAAQVRAPGTLASHYAPAAAVVLVGADDVADAVQGGAQGRTGLLAPASVATPPGVTRLAAPGDAAAYAREVYAALRGADALGLGLVVAVAPDGDGVAAAVRDRLTRAAAGR